MENMLFLSFFIYFIVTDTLAFDPYSFNGPLTEGPQRISHFALGSEQPGSVTKSKALVERTERNTDLRSAVLLGHCRDGSLFWKSRMKSQLFCFE